MVDLKSSDEKTRLLDSARLALLRNEHRTAYQALTEMIKVYPGCADAYFLLSRIAYAFKNHHKEAEMLISAYQLEPSNPLFVVYLARAFVFTGNTVDSVNLLFHAEHLVNHSAETLDVMGVAYNRLCMYQQAANCFTKAIESGGNEAGLFFNQASSLKFCGDFKGARAAYEKAIALNSHYYKAHAALTSLGGISQGCNHIDRLRELMPTTEDADDALCIAHALSKELETLKRFDESIAALKDAKAKKSRQLGYQFLQDKALFDSIKAYFSTRHTAVNNYRDGARSLFVVGMPRTGTTLVERIITNHSQVATGGELFNFSVAVKQLLNTENSDFINRDFIQKLDNLDRASLGQAYTASTNYLLEGKNYLVDKLPLNILYAGLIIESLPQAKIVCLDRNPMDTIVSNYRQLFSFRDSTFGYSLSLEDTARYYVEFRGLMTMWQALYPDNFYVVNYESLVTNPRQEITSLLDFCGLAWEEACLDVEKNTKPVATASAVQVRQPISKSSVGQWEQYADYLESVREILTNAGVGVKH